VLDSKKLGLAGGILAGVCMFVFTLIGVWTGYGAKWMEMMGNIYPGYSMTVGGSIVGFIYGFIDGFVSLFLLSWIYNRLLKKGKR